MSIDKNVFVLANSQTEIRISLEKIRGTDDRWENRRNKLRLQLKKLKNQKDQLVYNRFFFQLIKDFLVIPIVLSLLILLYSFKMTKTVAIDIFSKHKGLIGKCLLIFSVCIAGLYYLFSKEISSLLIDDTSFFYTGFILTFSLILTSCIVNLITRQFVWFISGLLALIPFLLFMLALFVFLLTGPWKFG
jgi:hypothetical protein